ncbi:MAG TPA: hypothetical protein DDX98_05520 [Bacteroidales bacterium]|jgi:hypothetical protein|nr:hypothetical protein [Bacteroidales bacterium]
MIPKRNKLKRIIGIVMLVSNIIWTGDWIWLYYGYHYTGKLWYFMYPDWVLFLNIFIGLTGVYLGYRLVKKQISIKAALLIDIPLFSVGFIVTIVP